MRTKGQSRVFTLRSNWPSIALCAALVVCAPTVLYAISIQDTLTIPDYEVSTDASGVQTISWKDDAQNRQGTSGTAGCPDLPTIKVDYGLPTNAEDKTVSVRITRVNWETLSGTYTLAPVPLPAATTDAGLVSGLPSGVSLDRGRDVAAYSRDAFVPARAVTVRSVSQSRKWKMADVEFCPFQYNAAKGTLKVARSVTFNVTFRVHRMTAQERQLLRDTTFDRHIVGSLRNRSAAARWYRSARSTASALRSDTPAASAPMVTGSASLDPASGVYADYVIITTAAIRAASTRLTAFVSMKQAQGFAPLVVDETTWGGGTGDTAANSIRSWLAANYASMGTKYVLFIGSGDPATSAVPMKMVWPRRGQSSDTSCPTDYFYADLTGSWDLNGNGFYGEYNGDSAAGGVDLAQEVIVGRIPYYGVIADLDTILLKIINYETATGDLSWRRKGLIAAAISNYANEDRTGYAAVNGSEWGNYCKADIFTAAGATSSRGYEKSGLAPVGAACEFALSRDNLISQWNGGCGFLTWWGHGSNTGAYRKYWAADDGDGVPEGGEMSWQTFIDTSDTPSISANVFPIAFQCSCLNGYPEDATNLQYALLKRGAIAAVGASRVSWYAVATWATSFAGQVGDNASYAYYMPKKMVLEGMSVGEANCWCRRTFGRAWADGSSYMNVFDFNVYGDPSLVVAGVASNMASLNFQCIQGQNAPAQQFDIWNSGASSLSYTISGAPDWLSVLPLSGTSTGAHTTHTATCTSSAKAPGTYNASLTIGTSTASNARLAIPCTLNVLPAGVFTVTSPNGGETWAKGTYHAITWTAGFGGTVKLDLYKGGVFRNTLAAKFTNTGSCMWNVQATIPAGTDYRIKVTCNESPANSDMSDGDFTIPPYVMVTAPLANKVWKKGATQSITWITNTGGNVKIDLYKGAALSTTLAASTPNTGSFSWAIPAGQTMGADYRVKISLLPDETVFYMSGYFSITGNGSFATVLAPTGNDIWQVGTTFTVRWNSDSEDGMKVELWKGTKVSRVLTPSTPNSGAFSWAIPTNQPLGNDYSVKVSCASNSAIFGTSPAFPITMRGVTISALTWAPATVRPGQAITLSGLSGTCQCARPTDDVRVVVGMRDSLGHWVGGDPVVAYRNTPGDTASHAWTYAGGSISAPTKAGGYYFWALNSAATNDAAAIAEFKALTVTISVTPNNRWVTLYPVTGLAILITSPNGGQMLSTGSTCTITWSSYVGGSVNIDLYSGSIKVSAIATNVPNNGTYPWTIPGTVVAGSSYRLKIASVVDATWTDFSDTYFKIVKGQ